MNHTAAAIREAADRGGYGYRWWKVDDIENGVGYNALPMRALTEHLYGPALALAGILALQVRRYIKRRIGPAADTEFGRTPATGHASGSIR